MSSEQMREREALQELIRAYVRLLESGKDRIASLGGDCDTVDVMERRDPALIAAKAALAARPGAQEPQQTGGQPVWLDDEGRAMVVNSHHYTAESVAALIADFKALESGDPDALDRHQNRDFRTHAGVLWRVISGLADGLVPEAAAPVREVPAEQPEASPSFAWSTNEENYHGRFDSIEEALGEAQESINDQCMPGETGTAYIGEVVDAMSYLRTRNFIASDVIERLDESLADEIGWDDHIIEMKGPELEELRQLILDFVAKKATFNAWGVRNVKEYELVSEPDAAIDAALAARPAAGGREGA